ncbi:MAG: hypothetical protein PUD23_07340, partial [Prevotella sp.]|nr:hypothetical protein [Prevotella sp.]
MEKITLAPDVLDIPVNRVSPVESKDIYTQKEKQYTTSISVGNRNYQIVLYGASNQIPYRLTELVEKNSVMMQNKYFNLLTCYGRGVEYMDASTRQDKEPKPTMDPAIRRWMIRNNVKKFFAEQIVDMKYFAFAVTVVILDRDRKKIVRLVHKDACNVRFELPDEDGKVNNIFFADWDDNQQPEDIEVIPLLDEDDPVGDLLARTGKERDELGVFRTDSPKNHKYAIVTRMPTPNCRLYPTPYWTGVLRDGWYNIYGQLTAAKLAKL